MILSADDFNTSHNEKCILQGLSAEDYSTNYGITVNGERSVELRFAALGPYASAPSYGSRMFVTNLTGNGSYMNFELLGKELEFTVDLSSVPAGMNAAVYLVSMDTLGNLGAEYDDGETNEAGWMRGVGYCDAQCPTDLNFVQGSGWNAEHALSSCCPEMDILEANRLAQALTPHPCTTPAASVCDSRTASTPKKKDKNDDEEEDVCAGSKFCDGVGGDANAYRLRGPGYEFFNLVDTTKPITVRTQFHTAPAASRQGAATTEGAEGDGSGAEAVVLERIAQTIVSTEDPSKSFELNLTDAIVAAQKEQFDEEDAYGDAYGGTAMMGAALAKGMVMVLSIWDDSAANMNWLDACTVADPVSIIPALYAFRGAAILFSSALFSQVFRVWGLNGTIN